VLMHASFLLLHEAQAFMHEALALAHLIARSSRVIVPDAGSKPGAAHNPCCHSTHKPSGPARLLLHSSGCAAGEAQQHHAGCGQHSLTQPSNTSRRGIK
jgi:hypothetical protein